MRILDNDEQFFTDHPDRQARIRKPIRKEMDGEFGSLGPQDITRRRIIAWKIPKDNPHWRPGMTVLKVPFLLFGDETVEDTDKVLLPFLDEIMKQAARGYMERKFH